MDTTRALLATGAFVATAGIGLLLTASATAAPPGGHIPAHQHYVVTADGDYVPVGPNACENGQSIQFDNFHNGHVARRRKPRRPHWTALLDTRPLAATKTRGRPAPPLLGLTEGPRPDGARHRRRRLSPIRR